MPLWGLIMLALLNSPLTAKVLSLMSLMIERPFLSVALFGFLRESEDSGVFESPSLISFDEEVTVTLGSRLTEVSTSEITPRRHNHHYTDAKTSLTTIYCIWPHRCLFILLQCERQRHLTLWRNADML